VVFDKVSEASGSFTSNLTDISPGPFNGNAAIIPPDLTGHVILTAVPSGTQLTNANGALNQITLNGSFSTVSGFSPAAGWSTHTFDNATFDLYKPNSYFATDFVTDPNNWPMLREALHRMGRGDLIGGGKHQLVPSWQPAGTGGQAPRRIQPGLALTQHTGLPPRALKKPKRRR